MMAKFTVTIEQADDGNWSAFSVEPEVIGGLGPTREAAIADWKLAMQHWLAYMKDNGQDVVLKDVEAVEVAA